MTLSHVTKGVSVTWRWCYYLPVDGREMVSPSVSIQGWGLTVNVDRLCHAPLEPLGFLVQNRHFVGGEWVICLGQMFPNRGRRSFMVFCDPVLELYREVLLHVKLERVRVTSHSAAQHCYMFAWWRHQMEIFSALLAICAGISPVTGELPAQRPATRSFAAFFDLHLNKQLSKQSWGW